MSPWLTWSSAYGTGYPRTQRDTCLCLLSPALKVFATTATSPAPLCDSNIQRPFRTAIHRFPCVTLSFVLVLVQDPVIQATPVK